MSRRIARKTLDKYVTAALQEKLSTSTLPFYGEMPYMSERR
jgi:hypothetical protein